MVVSTSSFPELSQTYFSSEPDRVFNTSSCYSSLSFQDVRVPVQLQRAMAAEAEAAREARAKVVAAEGEQKASLHLKEAALVLEESTSALQLRYLQVICQKSRIQDVKNSLSDTECHFN